MDEYEVLAGFDRKKLNDQILKEEDEIEYGKIRVSKTKLAEGIPHIRERHIDRIAAFFASLRIPDWKSPNPLEAYRLDLNLPEMFRQYHQALREIKGDIAQLEGKVDEKIQHRFRKTFYLEDLEHALRFCKEGDASARKNFEDQVTQNMRKLKNARMMLSTDDLDTIDCTIYDLLNYAVHDPTEIWREGDVHAYIAPVLDKTKKAQPEEKFICFVVLKDGRLFTAYFKKPEFKEAPGCHRIYSKTGD